MDPAGTWTRARVARDFWSKPRALGPLHESSGTAGRPCGTSDTGPSRPGGLVDSVGRPAQARVAPDIWTTLRSLGPRPEVFDSAG